MRAAEHSRRRRPWALGHWLALASLLAHLVLPLLACPMDSLGGLPGADICSAAATTPPQSGPMDHGHTHAPCCQAHCGSCGAVGFSASGATAAFADLRGPSWGAPLLALAPGWPEDPASRFSPRAPPGSV